MAKMLQRCLVAGLVVTVAVGCGGATTNEQGASQRSSGATESPQSQTASPSASSPPATLSGIAVVSASGNQCAVKALDPATGKVSGFVSFTYPPNTQNGCPSDNNPNANEFLSQFAFSPDFRRLATNQFVNPAVGQAGWIDLSGKFVGVSPMGEVADFGLSMQPTAIGFDKHDSFYYALEYGNRVKDDGWHQDLYKVPAGQQSQGVLVASIPREQLFDLEIGRIPGGEIAVTDGPPCANDIPAAEFDPDRTTYYYRRDRRVFTQPAFCGQGTPITEASENDVSNLVTSPDGGQVAFRVPGNVASPDNKIYVVGPGGQPKRVPGPDVAALEGNLYRWVS